MSGNNSLNNNARFHPYAANQVDDFENYFDNFQPEPAEPINYNFLDDLLAPTHEPVEPPAAPMFQPEPLALPIVDLTQPEPQAANPILPEPFPVPIMDPIQPGPSGLQANEAKRLHEPLRLIFIRSNSVVATETVRNSFRSPGQVSPVRPPNQIPVLHPSETRNNKPKHLQKVPAEKGYGATAANLLPIYIHAPDPGSLRTMEPDRSLAPKRNLPTKPHLPLSKGRN